MEGMDAWDGVERCAFVTKGLSSIGLVCFVFHGRVVRPAGLEIRDNVHEDSEMERQSC